LKPAVLITGVAGNLGTRLVQQLRDFDVIGADIARPATDKLAHFLRIDLAEEASCLELMRAIREFRPLAVVHVVPPAKPNMSGFRKLMNVGVRSGSPVTLCRRRMPTGSIICRLTATSRPTYGLAASSAATSCSNVRVTVASRAGSPVR